MLTVQFASAQCPAITCPGNQTVNNTPGTCGAVVTYVTPVGTNPCGGGPTTFSYTGAVQNYTVPVGVTTITIDAYGAQGGSYGGFTGGLGARIKGDVTVTPGQVLSVYVGGQGVPSQNAGGGGGGSGVSNGGTALVVAGAGGGACSVNGENGKPGLITTTGGNSSGAGGAAGNGGQKGYVSGDCGWAGGGGSNLFIYGCGNSPHGGSGGGGYSGGGAGGNNCNGAGGGGGSYNSGNNQSNTAAFQSGNGLVVLTYVGGGGAATTTQTAGLASGATFPVGTTTNTFQVSDGLGNTASCSFNVTVVDNEAPAITCPGNMTVNNSLGICGAVVNFNSPVGTDNCFATTSRTVGLASGSTFPIGSTTQT